MPQENKNATPVDQNAPSLIDALARRIESEALDTAEGVSDEAELQAAEEQGPRFEELGLSPALCRALADSGYTQPTGVQVQAIPAAMNGADLRVASSTGSGKTAAFMLPSLERIIAARGDNTKRREKGKTYGPRVLVLAPTRELAMQVAKAADTYGRHMQGLRVATIVGGVPYAAQLKALRGPLDVLIATPGRLLDHMGTGAAVLANLEVLILDEADRMLDMGFIDDIEAIANQTPENRQTLMFSATFAGHVGQLAQRLTRDAVSIEVASHTDSHDNIEQRLHLADSLSHKNDLLDNILTAKDVDQAVIFTSTQRDADILADRLADMGHAVAALHGGMPQGRRNRVLQGLRMRQLRVLVATDVAARGIDVPTITHVINYGMPMKPEDYVHRIGRTGRAGRSGLAITLCERRDIGMMRRIERFTTQRIPEAVIEGLEPKMKAGGDSRGPRTGKPMPGHRNREDRGAPRFGANREGGFGDRGGDRGFGGGDRGGFGGAPRGGDRGGFGGDRGGFNKGGFNADRGDRKPFGGDRPAFGDRPRGDRPAFAGDRPAFGDRPRGDRPFGDRPAFGDRPQGDRPFGKPAGKSFGDKSGGGKSFGDKPAFGGKPFGAKPGFKSGPKPGFGGKRPGFGKREG
ncbi:MAG: DEAD/DEAH box helicase [Burkholderiales bacterium]|jgi:superfamily II DNA/RNA helicase|nr:MAG: DEAD/DEAH box helicase [Burkholderiales bacterium]